MPTDQERLVVSLEARVRDFEKNFQRANSTANRQFTQIENRAKLSARRLETSLANSAARIGSGIGRSITGFGTAFLAGFTIDKAKDLIDASTQITNVLKVAGLEGDKLDSVYKSLFDSAQRNAVPIEDLVTLYSRASQAADNLGASQQQLKTFTDAVAMSLRVSGKSSQEASGALLQLSQLLSGNMVQAQEYNSLIDGAYPLLQAVAAGLKEAGGDVGKLTQLVKSGKVPTKAFFDAFLAGADSLKERLAGSELTISSSFVRLRNVFIDVATDFNKVTGVSKNVTDALNGTADAINSFDVAGFVKKIEDAQAKLHGFLSELGNSSVFAELNKALGITDAKGNPVPIDTKVAQDKAATLEKQVKTLQDTIAKNTELGFDNTEALAKLGQVQKALATVKGNLANMPANVPTIKIGNPADLINQQVPFSPLAPLSTGKKKKVTLADYKITGTGGGGKAAKAQHDRAKELIADLEQERDLIGATDLEREKANALRRAGANATADQKQKIGDLVTEIHNESEARAKQEEAMRRVADAEREFVGGLSHDLMNGVAPAEALTRALQRLADTILDDLLDSIFQVKNAGGGSGFLNNLISSIGSFFGSGVSLPSTAPIPTPRPMATGGQVRGPGTGTSDSIFARLSNGEFIVNAAATARNRNLLEAINSGRVPRFASGGIFGRSSGGYGTMKGPRVSLTINNHGNPVEADDVRKTTDKNGNVHIEAVIRSVTRDETLRPSAKTNRALRQNYGLTPQIVTR